MTALKKVALALGSLSRSDRDWILRRLGPARDRVEKILSSTPSIPTTELPTLLRELEAWPSKAALGASASRSPVAQSLAAKVRAEIRVQALDQGPLPFVATVVQELRNDDRQAVLDRLQPTRRAKLGAAAGRGEMVLKGRPRSAVIAALESALDEKAAARDFEQWLQPASPGVN